MEIFFRPLIQRSVILSNQVWNNKATEINQAFKNYFVLKIVNLLLNVGNTDPFFIQALDIANSSPFSSFLLGGAVVTHVARNAHFGENTQGTTHLNSKLSFETKLLRNQQ